MSVPEGKRGESKFEVILKAQELAEYTIQICCNPNVFLPQYQNALTNDIIKSAKDIFINCFSANNVLVKRKEDFTQRQNYQKYARNECNNLLALVQIAYKLFHLKTKRVKYWGQKIIEVRNLIQKWQEADSNRYKDL